MSVTINGTGNTITPVTVNTTGSVNGITPQASNMQPYNMVINGAMTVAQRGTSSTSQGFGTLDRMSQGRLGGTRTFSQQTLASGAPYDLGFRNYMSMENTSAGSTNTTDYVEVIHKIEAQVIANSGWNYKSPSSYITLSFWARSNVAGTYNFWIRDEDASSYTYGFNYTLAANTWTKVTHSIPGHSGLVFNNDNGAGLRIQWMAYYGSNYCSSSATLNSWSTGSTLPIHDTTWNTTAGATFDFTGVQLEVGSTASPFAHENVGDTLRKCQRYFVSDTFYAQGYMASAQDYSILIQHPVTMRANPTRTLGTQNYYANTSNIWIAGTPSGNGLTNTRVYGRAISTSWIEFGYNYTLYAEL